MSQKLVYDLLRELGGEAAVSDISRLARERYPKLTLHAYVGNRLGKLEKWGIVKKLTEHEQNNRYVIVEEYE